MLLPNYNFFNPVPNSLPVVQEHLDLADLVVLRTQVERDLCRETFTVDERKLAVVLPGISPAFAQPVRDNLFREAYGLDRFVLWVGALDEAKQQLLAIEALRNQDIPLIFIGGYRDRADSRPARRRLRSGCVFCRICSRPRRSSARQCRVAMRSSNWGRIFRAIRRWKLRSPARRWCCAIILGRGNYSATASSTLPAMGRGRSGTVWLRRCRESGAAFWSTGCGRLSCSRRRRRGLLGRIEEFLASR